MFLKNARKTGSHSKRGGTFPDTSRYPPCLPSKTLIAWPYPCGCASAPHPLTCTLSFSCTCSLTYALASYLFLILLPIPHPLNCVPHCVCIILPPSQRCYSFAKFRKNEADAVVLVVNLQSIYVSVFTSPAVKCKLPGKERS